MLAEKIVQLDWLERTYKKYLQRIRNLHKMLRILRKKSVAFGEVRPRPLSQAKWQVQAEPMVQVRFSKDRFGPKADLHLRHGSFEGQSLKGQLPPCLRGVGRYTQSLSGLVS